MSTREPRGCDTCIEVHWSEIKLNFISVHSNTRGLKCIHMHLNKTCIYMSKTDQIEPERNAM